MFRFPDYVLISGHKCCFCSFGLSAYVVYCGVSHIYLAGDPSEIFGLDFQRFKKKINSHAFILRLHLLSQLHSHRPLQCTFKPPLPMKIQYKCMFWVSAFITLTFLHSYASFYTSFKLYRQNM